MHVLARICVERPVFATVLSLVLLVVGIAGYQGLGVDRFPNVEFPFIVVTTVYPGAGPEEVETGVSDTIEQQVNTIAGIETLSSTSSDGLSVVMVQFALEKDVDVAAEEVRAKAALARSSLPPDAEDPIVAKFDVGAVPVLTYTVSANASLREIHEYVDKVLRRRIESVGGVGGITIVGGQERQVNVVLDAPRLRAYGVTVSDVRDALQKQNVMIPGGLVEQGDRQLTLRTRGRVESLAEFGDLPIENYGERVVYIRDVATVEDGAARATSRSLLNGRPCVEVRVIKQSGANAIRVIDAVKERIHELEPNLPRGYELTLVTDQSLFIEASLHAVLEHLLLGSLLAAIVVLLFLRSGRSTIITALAIPLSIIATFAAMAAFGFTQNVVTLLALTLSVGIVIDDAIVVLENIYRVIAEKGLSPREAAIEATREIGLAVLAITLSLISVFLPIALMSGIVGRFLNSFGITMAAAIAVSLFVSFSLTPMLCSRWLRAEAATAHADGHADGGWFGAVERGFVALLRWSMRHRRLVVLAGLGLIASIPVLGLMAKKNFLPTDDQSQFQFTVRAPEGTSLEATAGLLSEIATELSKLPEVRYTLVSVASDQANSPNFGTVQVVMEQVEDRADRRVTQFSNMAKATEEVLPRFEGRGLDISVQEVSAFGGGATWNIEIAVAGPDLDELTRYSEQAVARVRQIPGVSFAESSLVAGKPELQARIDRDRAAVLGAKVTDIATTLRLAVGGDDKITPYDEDGEQYEVHLRLDQRYRTDAAGIELLEVPAGGQTVPIDQVVEFHETTGPAAISRYNRQRQFTVQVNLVHGASQGTVTTEIMKVLEELKPSPEYRAAPIGAAREFARTFRSFGIAFLLSTVFMYLVIAAQFESFLHALVIMVALPLTVPFALISIIVSGDSLNIFSMLGMLVLLGVVKKNAILQIDFANQRRRAGMPLVEATIDAARIRLRPILMTTLAFVAGMIPLVIARGTGSATSNTIGGVILFGQLLSLLVTLVGAPVFYVMAENLVHGGWHHRLRARVYRRPGEEWT